MKAVALPAVVLMSLLVGCGQASQPSPVACTAPMVEVNNPHDFPVDVSYTPSRLSDRRQLGTVDPHMVVRLGPIERHPGGPPSFSFTYRMPGRTDLFYASGVRSRLVCP